MDDEAFTRLEEAMRAACEVLDGHGTIERSVGKGFWCWTAVIPELTEHPRSSRPTGTTLAGAWRGCATSGRGSRGSAAAEPRRRRGPPPPWWRGGPGERAQRGGGAAPAGGGRRWRLRKLGEVL